MNLDGVGIRRGQSLSDTPVNATIAPISVGLRRLRESRWTGRLMLALFIVVLVFVWLTGSYFTWSLMAVYGIFALGTSIPIGWSGLPAFGQGLFFAIGAYTMGFFRSANLPSIVPQLLGIVVAAVVAALIALVVTRMPFIGFSMITMIVAQAAYQFAYTSPITGGENGFYGILRGDFLGISLSSDSSFWWVIAGIVAVLVVLLGVAKRSAWGRKVEAVRLDPARAGALGINVRPIRTATFVIGAAVCALGGVLYAQLLGSVDPSIAFWTASTLAVVMVVVGGLGSIYGAVIGGLLYQGLTLYFNATSATPILFLGIVLVLVVLLTPGGLADIARRILRRVLRATESRKPKEGEEG